MFSPGRPATGGFFALFMKLAPLIVLLGGAVSGLAQGTVTFQNSPGTFATADPTGGNRRVYDVGSPFDPVNGNGLRGTQYVAELYAGVTAGSLAPVTASLSQFRASTSANKGLWASTVANSSVVLPGFDTGSTPFLCVRVWNSTVASSYEQAMAINCQAGTSISFTYKVPAVTDPPGNFLMEGLQAFVLCPVPEPSIIALGFMGVSGILFIRRRK